MKHRSLHIIVLSALVLSGCQENEFDGEYANGVQIRFNPIVAESGALTKAQSSTGLSEFALTAENGTLTIPMTSESRVGINVSNGTSQEENSSDIATRGSLINEFGPGAVAFDTGKTFRVTAWDDAATPGRIIPASDETATSMEVAYNGTCWTTLSKSYIWKDGETKSFYAFSNLPQNGASVTNADASAQTLAYTVPSKALDQTDILMGYYSGNGKITSPETLTGTASILFSHPLTAVQFKLGTIESMTFAVNSISIEGVYASGTAVMTPATAAKSDPKDRFTWTPSGTTTVSQSISSQPTTENPTIGEAFLLLPQTFGENSTARIVINCTINGQTSDFYYQLTKDDWKAGYTNLYTLGYVNGRCICFSAPTNHVIHLNYLDGTNMQYSTDGKNWKDCTPGTTLSFGTGNDLYFRGYGNSVVQPKMSWPLRSAFILDGDVSESTTQDVTLKGEITALIDYRSDGNLANEAFYYTFFNNPNLVDASKLHFPSKGLSNRCFMNLFSDCTGLVYVPEVLPATSLGERSYANMFENCTSLKTAPKLPAMNLGSSCYQQMFLNCKSLVEAPDLPAMVLSDASYSNMFEGCTSLTKAPELPATTISRMCYSSMFRGCTSLTKAPELPATTLANDCYSNMYYGCSSLTEVPDLPARITNFNSYKFMFQKCTSLEKAPEILATSLGQECCWGMFSECTSLTEVPGLHATTLDSNSCYRMFEKCTSLTKAPELPAETLTQGCYGMMFCECTSLTEAPELHSIALAKHCYESMFKKCTNLTKAPELPATTLANECYSNMYADCSSLEEAPVLSATILTSNCYCRMFYNCSKLKNITMLATDITEADFLFSRSGVTYYWLFGVPAGSGVLKLNADATWETSGIVPSGWTIERI